MLFDYTLVYLASKCLAKEVLVVAINTVCNSEFSSTSMNVLWSSVTWGSFAYPIREILVDFRFKHLSSRYPSSIEVSPKLWDNSRLTCDVSGLKRKNPVKNHKNKTGKTVLKRLRWQKKCQRLQNISKGKRLTKTAKDWIWFFWTAKKW